MLGRNVFLVSLCCLKGNFVLEGLEQAYIVPTAAP